MKGTNGMKGLILSGGRGTRLRPLTYSVQKQLIPVANKPILFYALEDVINADVHDIGIIVGQNADQVKRAVGSRSWDADITFIHQDEPKGLAHAILISRDYLKSDPFVMYLGDNLLFQGIREPVLDFISSENDASILLAKVENPGRFGVAEIDEQGRVVRLVEKPLNPPSDLALVGVYMFRSCVHEAVRSISPSKRGELEITDAIQWLIDRGYKVQTSHVKGWWKDTGLPEDLQSANRLVLDGITPECEGVVTGSRIEGMVRVGYGTIIEDGSFVQGPVVIGRNCRITGSKVGPYTSIGDNCRVACTAIENSIVMNGSKIEIDGLIKDSLIGADVNISRNPLNDSDYRFVLGDSSEVRI